MHNVYDLVIIGGGLAGLTLALQLKQADASITILLAEKARKPAPDACHKVGESSVEISSHYFRNVLGLEDELDQQLPKYGLRFYFSHQDNQKIEDRIELGANVIPQFRSYQIDRGRFENALLKKCQSVGIEVDYGVLVKHIELGKQDHQVTISQAGQTSMVKCRWLVDTSGRMALLKSKLKLHKNSYHHVNAAWFRIPQTIDINEWSANETWKNRVSIPRSLGTNHLVGKGYWVWLIPLCSGATSVGIVADAKLHFYDSINSYPQAINWLREHEPQCAEIVSQHQPLDFLTLEHFSHSSKQLYSADGWFISGDAGVFLDPLYSSGNDFIAMNNTLIADLIIRQKQGEEIDASLSHHQNLFRKLFLAFSQIYEDQYPILGNARIMVIKILWDFSLYWGGVALLFIHNKLCDQPFMANAEPFLQHIYRLNADVQGLLRTWYETAQHEIKADHQFIDYSAIPFLQVVNGKLLQHFDDVQLAAEMSLNLQLFDELSAEIRFEALSDSSQLTTDYELVVPPTSHLHNIFAQFKCSQS